MVIDKLASNEYHRYSHFKHNCIICVQINLNLQNEVTAQIVVKMIETLYMTTAWWKHAKNIEENSFVRRYTFNCNSVHLKYNTDGCHHNIV